MADKPPVKDLLKFILTEEDKPGASRYLKNSVIVENSCSSKTLFYCKLEHSNCSAPCLLTFVLSLQTTPISFVVAYRIRSLTRLE